MAGGPGGRTLAAQVVLSARVLIVPYFALVRARRRRIALERCRAREPGAGLRAATGQVHAGQDYTDAVQMLRAQVEAG